MHFILWLVVGGVAGWLAGLIMRDQGGILINIIVGIVGAAIAGFIFGGGADLNQALTIQSFIYSVIGAVILLAIVNLVRRGRVR
ncbi:GlsB/YeaQ/YmgE family stress response membrane protein [uncultured Sphingomonas sp.]|uniref:GlsB/YeaQ/YmgE family stress response membrane protein n=1 Tax=uncultured Sphingomonas sp. TaxID=158754 RepID=UPI0035CC4A25